MLTEEVKNICEEWGNDLAKNLKLSLELALKKGGRKLPQEAALNFENVIKVTPQGDVSIQIVASGDYWINIEDGRGAGKKAPPSKVIEKWIKTSNIDARGILAEMKVKQKGGLSRVDKNLSKSKKNLSYNEAAKRLSYVFSRSISRKGIDPKPYLKRVLNDETLEVLQERLSEVMKKEVSIELNLNNKIEPIKLTF
jgi:hypothetical protein